MRPRKKLNRLKHLQLFKRIRLTYFVKTVSARIRRLAYCSRIRCAAAHVIFRRLHRPSSVYKNAVRYALFRCDTLRYLLCDMTHWQRVVRISAKQTKLLIECGGLKYRCVPCWSSLACGADLDQVRGLAGTLGLVRCLVTVS